MRSAEATDREPLHGFGAILAAAALTVLCVLHPRLRVPSAMVLGALALGLVVTNGHWVGDIIGGVFLGIAVGAVTLPLRRRFRLGPTGAL